MDFTALLDKSDKGPWVRATWPGDCSGCGDEFGEDDEIRADGSGGWEARCCDDDE